MDESILQRLDERTDNLIKLVDKHVEDDKKKFEKLFEGQEKASIERTRSNTVLGVIIVLSQLVIAAWLKDLF